MTQPHPATASTPDVLTDSLRDMLKQKTDEATQLQGHYIRAFTVYLAITGGLLKFALDQNATPQLKSAMGLLGLLISCSGLLACLFGERLRRTMESDISLLSTDLGLPQLTSNLLSLKYTVRTAFVFVLIVVVSWLYVL